jgi:hypothetical protein
MATPTLLGLPREIRDRVIELAISHRVDPPQTLQDVSGWETCDDIGYYSPTQGQGVHYAPFAAVLATYPLLALCRQVRAETLDACRRLPMTCECDVVLLEEESLHVTFTYIPPLSRPHPDLKRSDFNVSFTIRQMGPSPLHTNGFVNQALHDNTLLPGRTTCYLIALFEHFIRCGPFASKSPNHDRNHPMNLATIDIVEGDEGRRRGTLPDFVEPHQAPEWRLDNPTDAHRLIHPCAMTLMMVNWFWVCASYLGQTQKKDLGYLMKRIFSVEFKVDGELLQTMRHAPPDGEWQSDDFDLVLSLSNDDDL